MSSLALEEQDGEAVAFVAGREKGIVGIVDRATAAAGGSGRRCGRGRAHVRLRITKERKETIEGDVGGRGWSKMKEEKPGAHRPFCSQERHLEGIVLFSQVLSLQSLSCWS